MERGDTFPAIVVVRPNASVKATPVDGNHLAKSAMLAGRESVAAYVVQGEPSSLSRWPQAVAGVPYRVTLSLQPFYDPDGS